MWDDFGSPVIVIGLFAVNSLWIVFATATVVQYTACAPMTRGTIWSLALCAIVWMQIAYIVRLLRCTFTNPNGSIVVVGFEATLREI